MHTHIRMHEHMGERKKRRGGKREGEERRKRRYEGYRDHETIRQYPDSTKKMKE